AYTVGRDTNGVYHNFMLQREAIDRTTLVDLLASFSQRQSDKGYFYKKLLTLSAEITHFKAITKVTLFEDKSDGALLMTDYTSSYFILDEKGQSEITPFIEVNHQDAIRHGLHRPDSPYYNFMKNELCGEIWEP
ncbi:hypothetical protein ACFOHL_14725, partial [Agaribacter flavus]